MHVATLDFYYGCGFIYLKYNGCEIRRERECERGDKERGRERERVEGHTKAREGEGERVRGGRSPLEHYLLF